MEKFNFNSQKFAIDFCKRAGQESADFPLDLCFFNENFQDINSKEYMEVLIYSLNNLPNLYVVRFILLSIKKYMINFDKSDWESLNSSLESNSAINTLMSFYQYYLRLKLSNEVSFKKSLSFDYLYEKDEEDFIRENNLNNQIDLLREKMILQGFISCD